MRPWPSFPASPSILGSGRSAIRFHSERYVRIVRVLQLNERGCALTHRILAEPYLQLGRLVAALDLNAAVPIDSLAYRFDIVLRGTRSTLFENKLQGN